MLGDKEVRFVYVKNVARPVTVAYVFDDAASGIRYNYAECGNKDKFNRNIGRAVSMGRLEANKGSHPNEYASYEESGTKYNDIAAYLSEVFDAAVVAEE